MPTKEVGSIDQRVVNLLSLPVAAGTPILLGDSNVAHMLQEHPGDYAKYSGQLESILSTPEYVARHPQNGSIEYIRVFDDHVLAAVRPTASGLWFVRTIFVMSPQKVANYFGNPQILKRYRP